MLMEQYFSQLEELVASCGAIRSGTIQIDKRSEHIGSFRAELHFHDGSSLHVLEYVQTRRSA